MHEHSRWGGWITKHRVAWIGIGHAIYYRFQIMTGEIMDAYGAAAAAAAATLSVTGIFTGDCKRKIFDLGPATNL